MSALNPDPICRTGGIGKDMGRTIAIIGGTGALGTGFAGRWAGAGHKVVIGSRTRERAQAAAAAVGGCKMN